MIRQSREAGTRDQGPGARDQGPGQERRSCSKQDVRSSQNYMLILIIKDLAIGDPENKGVSGTDPENKGVIPPPRKQEAG